MAEQAGRNVTEQNPLTLATLHVEILRERFGTWATARESVLTQWRGYQDSSVAAATGRTVPDVRRMRAEGGVDPADGLKPIPSADATDRNAHVVWLRFGTPRMVPADIAEKVGVTKQAVSQIIQRYING